MPRSQNARLEKRTDGPLAYWRIRVTVETPSGPRRKNFFCGYVRDGRKAALKRRLELLHDVNTGGLQSYEGSATFAELAQRFLEVRGATVAAATRGVYEYQLGKHILPALGHLDIAKIGRLHVEALCADKGHSLSWHTVDQMLRTIKSIFAAAVEWQMIGANPAAGVKHGRKTERHTKVILSATAFQALLEAVDQRTRCMIWVLASTGLRISELVGLKWADVDLDPAVLFISHKYYRGDYGEPKTARAKRICYLNPTAVGLLRRLPRTDGFIFSDDNGVTPVNERHYLRRHVRAVLRRLNLYSPGAGWHQFRRLFVSLAQQAGGSSIEAAALVGHASTSMTQHYTILTADRALALAAGVGQRLLPAGN
jgi:integrase